MQELLRSVLEAIGFKEIYTALDGQKGFEVFCQNSPDLVIADWMMSPINGITLANMIRTHKNSPNPYVPIILMTGFSQKNRVIEARDSGITEFMVKPFRVDDLYKRIERIIESPRQFVESETFFGPDRRRRKDRMYEGPKRRQSDELTPAAIPLENNTLIAKPLPSENMETSISDDAFEIDFKDRAKP